MKVCRWCQTEKALSSFYPHPKMADGHLNKCKDCVKGAVRLHRATHPDVQEQDRRRWHEGKKQRRRPASPPVVKRAHNAVSNAIRDGKLKRPDRCEQCERVGIAVEAAHSDYTRPMDVRWLCRRCHRLWDIAEPKMAGLAS